MRNAERRTQNAERRAAVAAAAAAASDVVIATFRARRAVPGARRRMRLPVSKQGPRDPAIEAGRSAGAALHRAEQALVRDLRSGPA